MVAVGKAQTVVRRAVDSERLRFARDLHDVLGHTLCAVALKGELARTVLRSQPELAERQLREILELVRTAYQEIRDVVSGYREISLPAELEGVCAVLRSAGIGSTVDVVGLDTVPESAVAPLAYALREGATNVLRHADATRCQITLRGEDGAWCLRMVNDGCTGSRSTDAAGGRSADVGNGLRGLRERLIAVGGLLRAGPLGDGGYQLVAYVPFP
jgi:two-component system sensor histidine kinase DesK